MNSWRKGSKRRFRKIGVWRAVSTLHYARKQGKLPRTE
jgi:hypothetical protein